MTLKQIRRWPFTIGGHEHRGWLPPGAATPLPTPIENELLDVSIERGDGGYLLIWGCPLAETGHSEGPPKSGDSWHATLADAEQAAREMFGIGPEDWTDGSAAG